MVDDNAELIERQIYLHKSMVAVFQQSTTPEAASGSLRVIKELEAELSAIRKRRQPVYYGSSRLAADGTRCAVRIMQKAPV